MPEQKMEAGRERGNVSVSHLLSPQGQGREISTAKFEKLEFP